MNLYPYLPLSTARSRAESLATLSRADLIDRSADWDESAIFTPIGGECVDRIEIRRLQSLVRGRMHDSEASSEKATVAHQKFDEAVAPLLLREMNISPHEASQTGLWAFLACVVLPDVVRWRFPGDDASGTSGRRFIGGARGIRNTLGRLWWRAYVFMDPAAVDPWQLVRDVGEDQSVQFLERPFLSGNPPLARAMLRGAIGSGSSRQQDVVRDVTKRLLRVGGIVPLEALPDEALGRVVSRELEASVRALASPGTLTVAAVPAVSPLGSIAEAAPSVATPATPTPTPSVRDESHPSTEAAETPPPGRSQHVLAFQARISQRQLNPGPMQGMLIVPDALAAALPPLEESYATPERNVIAVDADGHRWLWRYVHYNRSGEGRRLAGLTAFLVKHGAKPGDLLRLTLEGDGMIAVQLARAEDPPATR
jgi:hypothetical protein